MASIADLISNLKKKLKGGYNTVADALPIVPNTSQIKSFASNPVQFMANPSYNGGNNLYRTTPFKIAANTQNFIESNKSTADLIPRFQAPKDANLLRKASTFAYNIPIEIGASIVGRGVLDPALDMGRNIGKTITGRQLAGYEQVKSPATRLGYQLSQGMWGLKAPTDTKYTPKELLGNIGGVANPILDASTGSLAKNLATKVTGQGLKETAKILLKRGAIEGGLMGGASGLSLGLSENRKTKGNLDYAKNVLTSLATGTVAGAAIGTAGASAGLLTNKLMSEIRKAKPKASPQELKNTANKFIRDELGRFTGRIKDETQWIKDPYITDSQRKAIRRSLLLPEDGNYQGGFAKLDEPIVGTSGKSTPTGRIQNNPEEAIKHLLNVKNGEVKGAIQKDGIGDIDFVWGKEGTKAKNYEDGFGLAKIFKKHGVELVNKLPQIIREGQIVDSGIPGRTYVEIPQYRAVIRLDWDNQNKKWLLTAFDFGKKNLAPGVSNAASKTSAITSMNGAMVEDSIPQLKKGLLDFLDGKVNDVMVQKPQSVVYDPSKFSPTEMTREEKVLRDQLKRGEITPNEYNEIAVKNEGKVKPMTIKENNRKIELAKSVKPQQSNIPDPAGDELQRILTTDTPIAQVAKTGSKSVQESVERVKEIQNYAVKKATGVKEKVNILDYLRTPDRVLKKIGLGAQMDKLRVSYDSYKRELPIEINRITEWSKRAPEGAERIFRYLDGQGERLTGEEMKVATEIKSYLKTWADRLNLPEDKRITNYITHIFDKDFIEKEFDEDLAKIIRDKVAGSVYDPFTLERLGKLGYKENVWEALDAYVKRAVRKVNIDPALEVISKKSANLEESQFQYVKRFIDRVNLRPTEIDNLLDNTLKQIVGYKFGARPVASLSRSARQIIYRGTLGLNIGSAMKNLSQGVNTYAELGEKYTLLGYSKNAIDMAKGGDELQRVGVLGDDMIQDRTISATKKMIQKFDEGLFAFFQAAERVNRGSAYFGAKAKAIDQGMSEKEAIKYAVDVARKTQFAFGSIDTPVALNSDLAKFIAQLQTFALKQTEFLGEKVVSKDIAGLVRYGVGTFIVYNTIGRLYGMRPEEILPSFRFGAPPAVQIPYDTVTALTQDKDQYGNEIPMNSRLIKAVKAGAPLVPAGVQLKKTIEGLTTVGKGYSESQSGRVQYAVPQTADRYIRGGVFGKSNLPETRNYFDSNASVLSEKQSNLVKFASDKVGTYQGVMDTRAENKKLDEARAKAVETNTPQKVGNNYIIPNGEGSYKTINVSKPIEAPSLTGNTELDKKLISKYNSKLTSRATDIASLFEAGQIKADEAEKMLSELMTKKISTAKGKTIKIGKVPKIKAPKIKLAKVKNVKIKIPKLKLAKAKAIKLKSLKTKSLVKLRA